MGRIWRLIRVFTVGAMLVGGGSVGIASAQEDDGPVVFTIGSTDEITTLNPLKVYLASEYYILAWSYHLPFSFAPEDLSAVPDLATDVEVSEDGMTFTYTLQGGLTWSDGQPMTAEDMAFTMQMYQDSHAYIFSGYLTLMDSIEAVDETTVVLRSKQPTSLYAGNYLYAYVLPKHVWEGFDRPKQFENYPNVGSGPFLVEEWRTGEFIRMVRNPEWSGPEPYIDEVVWRYFKSQDAVAEALKAGEIDFAYFTAPNIFNSVKDEPNIETMVGVLPSFDEIGMNTGSAYQDPDGAFVPHGDGHPALTDVMVRRAIRMAIDSQQLSEKVYLGYAPPGDTIVPPVTIAGARWEPPEEERLAWDIEAANALLDEAGYLDTDGDGVREMPGGGQPLEFRYFVRTSDQTTIDAAPFVQSWLEQIGIKTEVTAMSSGRLGDVINAGEYDLFDWGWIPDIDPNSILSYFTCDQRPPDGTSYGNNDAYYCNPAYDELFLQQQSELDPQRRLEMIHELQRIFYNDAAYVVKWYSPLLQAYRTDTFTGYIPQPQPEGDLLSGYSRDAILSIRPVGLDVGGGDAGAGGEDEGAGPGTGAETRGVSAGVWIGIGAGVVVLVTAILLLRRRRTGEDEA